MRNLRAQPIGSLRIRAVFFESFVVVRRNEQSIAPASGHNAMSYAASERLVCHFMLSKLIVIAILSPALVLTACSHPEPLQTSTVAPVAATAVPISDQTVIAETVGRAAVGSDPLAWANPSTGSAGVIEQVRPGTNNPNGCRDFVTSKQSLEGVTRFNGVACPADGSWKINGSPGLH
ncbi:RT0821/Lpp0805 family surface protein (plasmid) [Rhizobium ruizarguesonis]|nr:RT0821/Lpp0805 family surface protein [Rhizobium ruizarguesonis]